MLGEQKNNASRTGFHVQKAGERCFFLLFLWAHSMPDTSIPSFLQGSIVFENFKLFENFMLYEKPEKRKI